MRTNRKLALFDDSNMTPMRRKSLYYVIWAVMFGNFCFTITGGPAWSGYLKELGANDLVYSFLLAIPFVGTSIQLLSSVIIERSGKRRELFIYFGLAQRITWAIVAVLPYFIPFEKMQLRIWLLMLLILSQSVEGAFMNTAFFSFVGDMLPMRIRGRYFAVRSRLSTAAGIVASLLSAFLLDLFPGMTGYSIVLIMASLMGVADIVLFFFIEFPEQIPVEKTEKIMPMLKEVLSNKSFMRFTLSWTLWCFAMNVSAPFFNPLMTNQLQMKFTEISIWVTIISSIATMIAITRWGRMIDEYGNKPVMCFCSIFACLTPIMWMFTRPDNWVIIPILQFLNGIFYCAIDLGAQNLSLGLSPDKNRSLYIAFFFILTQLLGAAPAMVVGGAVVSWVEPFAQKAQWSVMGFPITHYKVIILVSCALRIITAIFVFPRMHEKDAGGVRQMLRGLSDLLRMEGKQALHTAVAWPQYTRRRIAERRLHKRNAEK